ncbi:MAG: hypothetical protein U5K31_11095 [Balneolaceae bacterium]|nr:hypothetical protein [Balneolaceae bacterium]
MSPILSTHRLIAMLTLLLAGLLFQSCLESHSPPVCTLQFEVHQVTVLNAEGEAADSVQIQITNQENGESFRPCERESYDCPVEGFEGRYTIIHDGYFEHSEEGKEFNLRVTGQKDEMSFQADYTFRNDGCHIRKVAGPDSVSLEASN